MPNFPLIALETPYGGRVAPFALGGLLHVWGCDLLAGDFKPLHPGGEARALGAIANLAAMVARIRSMPARTEPLFVAGYMGRTWTDIGEASTVRYQAMIASVVGEFQPSHTILLDGSYERGGALGDDSDGRSFARRQHIHTVRLSMLERAAYTRLELDREGPQILHSLAVAPRGDAQEREWISGLFAKCGITVPQLKYRGLT